MPPLLIVVVAPVFVPIVPLSASEGAVASSVKASADELPDTLPAVSVWRTSTLLAPSPLSVKLVPVPATQVVPPSVLYCQLAPASSPLTLAVPTLVILSVELDPESVA